MTTNIPELGTMIRVSVSDSESGLFYATSPDLKGLLTGAPTVDGLYNKVSPMIASLWEAKGMPVAVFQLSVDNVNRSFKLDDKEKTATWVFVVIPHTSIIDYIKDWISKAWQEAREGAKASHSLKKLIKKSVKGLLNNVS